MNTISATHTQSSRRKLIDIPEDVFRALSVKAAATGLDLKKYIEQLLIEVANEPSDADVSRMPFRDPSRRGKIMLKSEARKANFENWLDSKRQ